MSAFCEVVKGRTHNDAVTQTCMRGVDPVLGHESLLRDIGEEGDRATRERIAVLDQAFVYPLHVDTKMLRSRQFEHIASRINTHGRTEGEQEEGYNEHRPVYILPLAPSLEHPHGCRAHEERQPYARISSASECQVPRHTIEDTLEDSRDNTGDIKVDVSCGGHGGCIEDGREVAGRGQERPAPPPRV